MNNFNWSVLKESDKNKSRLGRINTPHGIIDTPAFIFCATKAALKTVSADQAKNNNTQIILSNTYHLMLQPGSDIIADHGGLHNFMNWKGPMLTDSGGFQIFSLGYGSVAGEIKGVNNRNSLKNNSLLKISEEGAKFRSYLDGSINLLTPEKSINIQRKLGADLILVLDECTPYHISKNHTNKSMIRSHNWALRSLEEFNSNNDYSSTYGSSGQQKLYGIIQGGVHKDLRDESIEFNLENNFFGLAIGGSLGANKEEMHDIVDYTSKKLGSKNPVHLLGIGDPIDIWNLVESGIDTFDCVMPTRIARHGSALSRYNSKGRINIKNSIYKKDQNSLEENCACSTCNNYSKSYIHHLFKSNEILGLQLLSLHNIFFMNSMMKEIRKSIDNNNFEEAKKNWIF